MCLKSLFVDSSQERSNDFTFARGHFVRTSLAHRYDRGSPGCVLFEVWTCRQYFPCNKQSGHCYWGFCAPGDNVPQKFLDIPDTLVCQDQKMLVIVERRRPHCWSCGNKGHLSACGSTGEREVVKRFCAATVGSSAVASTSRFGIEASPSPPEGHLFSHPLLVVSYPSLQGS